ncbi:MAG: hypothetical protein AMXMBFR7_39720 [Planctomycetota bacterium]
MFAVVNGLAVLHRCPSKAWLALVVALCASRAWSGASDIAIDSTEYERQRIPLEQVKEHVAKLSSLGSRVPGTEGHLQARRYVIEQLRGMGYAGPEEPKTDDALKPQTLDESAKTAEGQSWSGEAIAPFQIGPRNVRIHVVDWNTSLQGGTVVLTGEGPDGAAQTEELTFQPTSRGEVEVSGDKRFTKLNSILVKNLKGDVTPGEDTLSAGWGVRYFIGLHRFWGTIPAQIGPGRLLFTETPPEETPEPFPLYAIWPNGTAVTTTGPDGVTGPLIYARSGRLSDFDNLPVKDSIVLLDVGDDSNWTLAASLGARAVIFIEPEQALRPVLQNLAVQTPVEFPRLWIPRGDGLKLKETALRLLANGGKPPVVNAYTHMQWKREQWDNIYLLIPGAGPDATITDEAQRKEITGATVVLAAYYDSNSLVPSLAPGAEQSISCAALLALARQYKHQPPARDVLLLFSGAHFQGLKGEREFFAEVDRLPLNIDETQTYEGELAKVRSTQTINKLILADILQKENLGLEREELRLATQQAVDAYLQMPFARADQAFIEAAISRPSLFYLVLGILLLAAGIAWFVMNWPARGFSLAVLLTAGTSFVVYGAAVPWLQGKLKAGAGAVNPQERMDGFLDLWKQEVNTRETDKERESRLLRYEGQNDTELQNKKTEERRAYEFSGQLLYSLSSSGFGIKPETPTDPAARQAALRETAELMRRRVETELSWVDEEFKRLALNRPFQDLVYDRLSRDSDAKGRKSMFLSLDLSAGNPGIGLFYLGNFYGKYGDIESRYKNFGRSVMNIAKAVERAAGGASEGQLMPDTLLESGKRSWQTYMGTSMALASEIAVQAQMRGLTLATPYDRRMVWDTPQDHHVSGEGSLNWTNVDSQLSLAGTFLRRFLAEPAVTGECRFDKGLKNTGYSQLIFRTVRRGGSRSIFPNIPVGDTVIHRTWREHSVGGVRLCLMEATNPLGRAYMPGLMRGGRFNFEAEKSDPDTGEIQYSINKAKHKLNENQTFSSHIAMQVRRDTVEIFRAQGVGVLDVVDPGRLTVLRNCTLLAGQTESGPLEFGTSSSYWHEPHRVLFAEPGSRVKVLFREGEFGLRVAVLDVDQTIRDRLLDPEQSAKVSLDQARGPGFRLGTRKVLDWLPMRTASDLWCLGEKRLQNLRSHSIGNAKLDNPLFPGPYSAGTITVAKDSDEAIGTGVEKQSPDGPGWDERVVGLPLQIGDAPESFRVEKFIPPNKLVLDRPCRYDLPPNRPFLLTKEQPGLHNITKMRLQEAQDARQRKQYGEAWRLSTEAWGLESRAYPEVLGTANDSVMGVVFYLFLLLPFCFFVERLLFAMPKIEHQIGAFFGIFVGMFVLLWLVHPAFDLVAAPPVILLAFVIMSLAGIVIAICYGKFNTEMRMMQQGMQGTQSADVNRASAAMVAVSLGISQMRRRKVRTLLTCLTIILLTFTALSFTSTVRTIGQAHIDLSPGDEQDARYNGILLRQLNYDRLSLDAFEQMRRELANEGLTCTPRFWRVAAKNEKILVDIFANSAEGGEANRNERMVSPACMVGFSHSEAELFPELRKKAGEGGMIVAGSWLEEGDTDVCLLPEKLIEYLRPKGIAKEDWNAERAIGVELMLGSHPVKIKGIFRPEEFDALKDLDDEPLTPVDFSASEASRGAEQQTDATAQVENLENAKATKYEHINGQNTLILPWRTAQLLGADLRSVAAKVQSKEVLDYMVERLLKRIEKNLFVGRDGRRRLYASTGKLSLSGLGNLLVPLLISILILLNTMIGAVYERNREITIFSALGLAPSHIAALFLAEALVYATLGAIFGYLLGQGAAKFIQLFGEQLGVAGLYLNYSSSSAVFVTAIVMLSVIGSTIYPAMMAARAAAPSEERRWSVPVPVGDEISLELPFSFQRDLVPGAALFLHEFFESHAESSLGKFTAKEVTLETFHTENGQGLCIFFMAWLTPYDLGVSQEVQIYVVPTDDEGLYVTEATFYRVSGYVASWRRVNLPFLNALRKHLLIWRTYSPEQRMEYSMKGFYRFNEAFEAVGWPIPPGARPPQGLEPPELDEEGAVIGPGSPHDPQGGAGAASLSDGPEPAKA